MKPLETSTLTRVQFTAIDTCSVPRRPHCFIRLSKLFSFQYSVPNT